MQYGYLGIENEFISNYMGPTEKNKRRHPPAKPSPSPRTSPITVSQRDATLLYLQHKVRGLIFLISEDKNIRDQYHVKLEIKEYNMKILNLYL